MLLCAALAVSVLSLWQPGNHFGHYFHWPLDVAASSFMK